MPKRSQGLLLHALSDIRFFPSGGRTYIIREGQKWANANYQTTKGLHIGNIRRPLIPGRAVRNKHIFPQFPFGHIFQDWGGDFIKQVHPIASIILCNRLGFGFGRKKRKGADQR
jgi:hypothetical protein